MMEESSGWATGLELNGVYYEGLVEDLEGVLDKFRVATVTTYGTRRQKSATSHPDKENKPVYEVSCNSYCVVSRSAACLSIVIVKLILG